MVAQDKKLTIEDINLHHFTLKYDKEEIEDQFNRIEFIFIAGCHRRAHNLAKYLTKSTFNGWFFDHQEPEKLTLDNSRFDLYRVGSVLVANHGMGSASMSIALHELFLISNIAGILNKITVIRFGTCKLLNISLINLFLH